MSNNLSNLKFKETHTATAETKIDGEKAYIHHDLKLDTYQIIIIQSVGIIISTRNNLTSVDVNMLLRSNDLNLVKKMGY